MQDPPRQRTQQFGDRLALGLLRFAESITTFDVAVPWKHPIRFPDRCTRCAVHQPKTAFTVSYTKSSSLAAAYGLVLPAHRKRVTAPVCAACHAECVRRRRLQRFIPFPLMATLLLSGLYGATLLHAFSPTLSAILKIAAILGSAVVAITVSLVIGDPFPTTQGKDDLTFHFKNPDLAHDFALANGLEVTEPEPIPHLEFTNGATQTDQEVDSRP